MPNWCENDLWITGPKEDLQRFASEPLTLSRFIPIKEESTQWCVDSWGTKWDIDPTEPDPDPYFRCDPQECLFYTFLTAWTPPIPTVGMMAKVFPTLSFSLTYFESGVAFNGILIAKEGMIIKEDSGPYYGDRGG